MIDAVLVGLLVIVRGLLDALPDWEPPSWVTDNVVTNAAETMGTYASEVGYWVPWSTVATVVSGVVALYGIVVGARLALWLWSKVPGVGK